MILNKHTLVKWFQLNYPKFVKDMIESSHHYSETKLNPYHLEGSVFTHTMLVINQLEDGNDVVSQHVLIAALLHDIGKPISRKINIEKERVNFFGHEPMSAFLALDIVDHIVKDFKLKSINKRLLIEMIALHTEGFKLNEKQLTERLINNHALSGYLTLLSNADQHGRFYEDEGRLKKSLEIKTKDNFHSENTVILMVGLPCSGKSTIIKEKYKDFAILSRDDIVMELGAKQNILDYNTAFRSVNQEEVDQILEKRKREYIKKKLNVVIDMTNMSRKSRRKRLSGFKGYEKHAHVVMTSLLNIKERDKNREGKGIPDHVFENMSKSFYPPLYDEFDEIHWSFN